MGSVVPAPSVTATTDPKPTEDLPDTESDEEEPPQEPPQAPDPMLAAAVPEPVAPMAAYVAAITTPTDLSVYPDDPMMATVPYGQPPTNPGDT